MPKSTFESGSMTGKCVQMICDCPVKSKPLLHLSHGKGALEINKLSNLCLFRNLTWGTGGQTVIWISPVNMSLGRTKEPCFFGQGLTSHMYTAPPAKQSPDIWRQTVHIAVLKSHRDNRGQVHASVASGPAGKAFVGMSAVGLVLLLRMAPHALLAVSWKGHRRIWEQPSFSIKSALFYMGLPLLTMCTCTWIPRISFVLGALMSHMIWLPAWKRNTQSGMNANFGENLQQQSDQQCWFPDKP